MDTERYCTKLWKLERVDAIRAIQQAYLQLAHIQQYGCEGTDNKPAMNALLKCLRQAGHPAGDNL
jgi:hypothetical protein